MGRFDILLGAAFAGFALGSSAASGTVRGVGAVSGSASSSSTAEGTVRGVGTVSGAIVGSTETYVCFAVPLNKSDLIGNIIFAWPGTFATIPDPWEQHPDFAGAFGNTLPKFPVVTEGLDVGHGLAALSHVHPLVLGQHTVRTTAASLPETVDLQVSVRGRCELVDHTHPDFETAEETIQSAATANTIPSHIRVIFIRVKAGFADAGVPPGAWAFWDGATAVPTGWTLVSSSHLLAGALAGANANLSPTAAAVVHTHDESHSHQSQLSSASVGSVFKGTGSGIAEGRHRHSISVPANSGAWSNATSIAPPFQRLGIIRNDTALPDLPDGIMGLFAESSIPAGWTRVHLTSPAELIAGAANEAAIGNTGGSAGHTHTSPTHNHLSPIVAGPATTQSARVTTPGMEPPEEYYEDVSGASHTHAWAILGVPTAANSLTAPAPRSDYPPYWTVHLLKFAGASVLPLSGTATGSCVVTAVVRGAGKVTGASVGSSSLSGVVRGTGRARGAAVGSCSLSGVVRGTGKVHGSAIGETELYARVGRFDTVASVPDIRAMIVRFEQRSSTIRREDRSVIVPSEDRFLIVPRGG